MRKNLLETYSRQLKVAEAYVAKNFGHAISKNTELTTAVLLDNTNRWMTESMNSVATQRTDLGDWKKFCLNLTNLAVPSLIANDLVIVHPMTSYSGNIAYLEYASRTNKGDIKQGDVVNSVFGFGDFGGKPEARRAFTSQTIVETVGADGKLTLTPMTHVHAGLDKLTDPAEYAFPKEQADIKIVRKANGKVEYAKITGFTGGVATLDGVEALAEGDKVAYLSEEFQMEHVPAQDIPAIGPVMKHLPLVAEPRRIAVRYDQITAFQA